MKSFKRTNNIFGWLAFAVAALTYLFTMEPTASFWDCPEFITTAYRLEVGHPPGAPLFMLMGRFFTLFASDVQQVALMVNAMSALASAFTILFLFWTITRLARKILIKKEDTYSLAQTIGIIGAGLVGALAYTFSDSFWFSAVEAEVYASSSFFTAIVFWAILKWEEVADKPFSDRWLVLIAYLMGLSIGVHLLNLLAIPAIVLVYYFKKFKFSGKGTFVALLVSMVLLGLLMYGLIPGILEVASWFDLLFVNSFGMSFNSGVLFYCALLLAVLAWSIYETFIGNKPLRIKILFILSIALLGIPFIGESLIIGAVLIASLLVVFYYVKSINIRFLNTVLIALTAIVIGYSSFAVIVIRSAANPPMDQNSPENIFALQSYLNREQYGDRPLIYGPYYNAEVKRERKGDYCVPKVDEGKTLWSPKEKIHATDKDEFIVTGKKQSYVYDEQFCSLFPRMWSSQENHVNAYKDWAEVRGKEITYETCGDKATAIVPTFTENLRFFFTYQVGFMYFRYFMWNFSGRQNDAQSFGQVDKGNFITGFSFIDKWFVGPQDNLPPEQTDNKSRNVYYLMPFLLGIIGLVWQINQGRKGMESFWLTGILFFMTGLAIVLYLNQTPYQPRERDYAYAGSFYAFAIWIGLGVLGLASLLEKAFKNKTLSVTIATLLCLVVPAQMASQNWDDHDRTNRTTTRDFGYNYLISCAPNAIIFTNGDNDTFPLWYLQEVEGVRRDVRVCNLSYLQTDWYIDQMRRDAYESKALPISWKRYQYVQGTRDITYVYNLPQFPSMDAKTAIQSFVLNPDLLDKTNGVAALPTSNIFIPIDKEQVVKLGIVKPELKDSVLPQLDITLKNRVFKHEMMILEMLSQNNWERPIYFSVTVGDDYYMGLGDHFQLEGLGYRIVPLGQKGSGGSVNTDIMFDNMVNKFRWGNIDDPRVYLDENNLRMCRTFRLMFFRLVEALIQENKPQKALQALDYCMKVIPSETVKHDYYSVFLGAQYYTLKQYEKGDQIMDELANNCAKNIAWYRSLTSPSMINASQKDLDMNMRILASILAHCREAKRDKLFDKYVSVIN